MQPTDWWSRSWRGSRRTVLRALRALEAFGHVEGSEASGTLRDDSPAGSIRGRYRYDGEQFTLSLDRSLGEGRLEAICDQMDRICGFPVATA